MAEILELLDDPRFTPHEDRVYCHLIKPSTGILHDPTRPPVATGIVKKVGPGLPLGNGQRGPMFCKVGDTIVFGWGSGARTKIDGVEVNIIRESEILGITNG